MMLLYFAVWIYGRSFNNEYKCDGQFRQTKKVENKFEWFGYIVVQALTQFFCSFIVFQMVQEFIETILLSTIRFIVELLLVVLMHLQR